MRIGIYQPLAALLFTAAAGYSGNTSSTLSFEPNRGQTDPQVQFLSRTANGAVFLTGQGIVLHRDKATPVRISFPGSQTRTPWQGTTPTGNKTHYYIGRDQSKWIHGLQSFERAKLANLYPGIDLVLYGNAANQLEYDLIVAPGADPSKIRLHIDTAAEIEPHSGDLVIGGIRQHKPVIFQGSTQIAGEFKKYSPHEFGFTLAAYDKRKPLTIDPVIESREYLGGVGDDVVNGVSGGIVTGTTASIDFPGAQLTGLRHGTDVFMRLSFASTYILGGSGDETAANITLPFNGSFAFLAGTTTSRDLPTTGVSSPSQAEFQGGATDGFVWLYDPGFPPLPARNAYYFGSAGDDRINSVTMNRQGKLILGGTSNGSSLPAAGSSTRPQATNGGGTDAFLAVGFPVGFGDTVYRWQNITFLGGSGDDRGLAVATVADDSLYLAGETASANFPLAGTPTQSQRRGTTDGFLARYTLGSDGSLTLSASTLLGGGSSDRINSLATWGQNIAATGTTASVDFPTLRPFQGALAGGGSDAFVTVFNTALTQVNTSSFFGGSGADEGLASAVDTDGNFFFGGKTSSRDLRVQNAVQNIYGGGLSDGYIVSLNPLGAVAFITYYGGSGDDEVLALGGANGPTIFAGGATTSSDLPGPAPRPGTNTIAVREGFVARITTTSITMPNTILAGKNTRQNATITFHDTAKALAAGRATVESADPSIALVAFRGLAGPSDLSLWETNPSLASGWPTNVSVECLVDSGETSITVRVPGFPDQSSRVRCLPTYLLMTSESQPRFIGDSWQLNVQLAVNDPATGQPVFVNGRFLPETRPIRSTVVSSNPDVVFAQVSDGTYGPVYVFALASGTSTVTLSAPGFQSASMTVTVGSSVRAIEIAPGFSVSDYVTNPTASPIVVRSANTARVSLANDPWSPAVPEILAVPRDSKSFGVRMLSGTPVGTEVALEWSVNGTPFRPFRLVRAVAPIAVLINQQPSALEPFRMQLESTRTIELGVGNNPRNFGQPATNVWNLLTVESSNPAVATAFFSDNNGDQISLNVKSVSAGTAVLTLRAAPGLRLSPELAAPISVLVTDNTLSIVKELDLGKDLQTYVQVQVPTVQSSLVVTTSTPELIQFVTSLFPPQLASSVTFPLPAINSPTLLVTGLASQGEGKITATIAGRTPVTATVRLRPSGFTIPPAAEITKGGTLYLGAPAAALDPATRSPILYQEPRFGQRPATLGVENSNPNVVSLVGSFIYFRDVIGLAEGQADLTLRQPDGFTTPATGQRMRVTVVPTPPQPKRVVRVSFTGRGSISGTIACSSSPCVQFNDPLQGNIAITATPAPGFRFDGWFNANGYCTASPQCSFNSSNLSDLTAIFTPVSGLSIDALQFVPVTPCRLVDTRNANGPLGGPALVSKLTRNFAIRSACGLPANARAYSLNFTVVPRGTLGYLSVWPGGQPQAVVSTLNSIDGRVKANAAIVAAGTDGSIDVYATDATDVIIDVNGAFIPPGANSQAYYAVTPCRISDTRTSGGSPLAPLTTRAFPVANTAGCGIPTSATAYALNVTAVPKTTLGYITLWPGGSASARPTVSTLNAPTGTVTANMAIVPAGSAGDINAFATEATDLILDVVGYYGPAGQPGALNLYPLTPCRIADTRLADGSLGGPVLQGGVLRDLPVIAGPCGVPSTSKAYAVSATVVPSPTLGYLTLFPTGVTRPLASTLNAVDGAITSNAAIVPAGLNGAISAFVTERTHLILDINGYFAP